MQVLTRIALLVILGVSCTCGQDEDLLGLPEYDIFGLDADDNYYKEREDRTNLSPEELLKKLCYEYDLQLNDQRINCQNLRIVSKALQINEHLVQKREAEETYVEGSGDFEQIAPAEEPQANAESVAPNQEPASDLEAAPQEAVGAESNEPPAEEQTPAEAQSSDTGEESAAPEAATDEAANVETPVLYAENPTDGANPEPSGEESAAPEVPTDEAAKVETPVLYAENPTDGANPEPSGEESAAPEAPTDEGAKVETPVLYGEDSTDDANPEPSANEDTNSEGQSSEPPANEEVSVEPNQNQAPTEATDIAEASPKPEESPVQEITTTEAPVEAKEAATVSVKKGRILSPVETDTAKESEANSSDDSTNHEKLHQHQSANTVVDSSGTETLAGSDAAVKKMAAKENLKESDLPKSGESSENPQQARKDSKILIILLVAVVVIGCAAFAYNFIKKRKQKKTETRTENGNSAQQRATPADKDTEQGTELKPLMKINDEKPVVEYQDEKTAVAK